MSRVVPVLALCVLAIGPGACTDRLGGACREHDDAWSETEILEDTTRAYDALRALSGTAPQVESLNAWGGPRIVGGLSIPLETLGCDGRDAEGAVRCLLEAHGDAVGLRDLDAELAFDRVRTESSGHLDVSFDARYAGYPVDGGLAVQLAPGGAAIWGFVNYFRPNLHVTNQGSRCLEDVFGDFSLDEAIAAAAAHCGRDTSTVTRLEDELDGFKITVMDAEVNDFRAARCLLLDGLDSGHEPDECALCGCFVEVDVVSYEVLRLWPRCNY